MSDMVKKPELLSPVADFTMLNSAIKAGCDSVYFGVKELNMRMGAKNFGLKDLGKVVKLCHENKIKSYLTVNTIVYENEISKVEKVLKAAKKAEIDAIICWDRAVVEVAKKLKLELHLSTQASVSNSASAKSYMKDFGVKRIILARECSLDDIKKIHKKLPKLEVEAFVHGAMCVSLSGRCFMSEFTFGKSANRGECLQNCRREYIIKDVEKEFELKLGNNYVMSPKDLCCIEFVDKLINAGVGVFKIEGRNRSPEYVKVVTECYRKAIDAFVDGKFTSGLKKKLLKKLGTVYNRGFSSGFYLGKPINEWTDEYGSKAVQKKSYIGKVVNYYSKINVAEVKLESGSICKGDLLMVQGPTTGVVEQKLGSIEKNKKRIAKSTKGDVVGIKFKEKLRKNDLVYIIH